MRSGNLLLGALQLLGCVAIGQSKSADSWTQMQAQCQDASAAIHQAKVLNERHCTMQASDAFSSGLIVAQFNLQTLECSLFRYQSVCRSLASGSSSDCRLFIRFPMEYPARFHPNLTKVWLGDDLTRFENLLCQTDEDMNRMHPVDVQWTQEGAKFNGNGSHLVLNKSDIGFTSGGTVLIRFKRKPQVQPLFEFTDCADFTAGSPYNHLWEYDAPSKLYALFGTVVGNLLQIYQSGSVMSASEDDWVDFGFTTSPTGDLWGMFLNNAFLAQGGINVVTNYGPVPSISCLRFGKRVGEPTKLNGTVKAIAIGGSVMTESEIREFFALLP